MNANSAYLDKVQTLSEGSVRVSFDAFKDIPWDDPEYKIDHDDPRWILPDADPLGRTEWYKSLPIERQIEVGLARQANVCRVGWQFENLLIRGVMEFVFSLPNGDPQFRYLTHEVTEETHHTQMFNEFVNRSGTNVPGMRRWLARINSAVPLFGRFLPEQFFTMVLAGEEPIDHIQKLILRAGNDMHPLLERIMQIHVAEEARHISFAHEYLHEVVPTLNPARKMLLSVTFPLIMRIAANLIVVPSGDFAKQAQIPREVMAEAFWDSDDAQKVLRDVFADVRALADECGLMNPVSRRIWAALGIEGQRARFRSQPSSLAA